MNVNTEEDVRAFDISSFDVNNDQHFSIVAKRYYDLQTELIEIESWLMQGEHDESSLDETWCRMCNADHRFRSFAHIDKCNERIDLLHPKKSKTEIEYENEIPF